jgi:hypothetical protein
MKIPRQTRGTPARLPVRRPRPRLETLEARDVPSFAAPVSYPGSAPAAPVIAADVNHDGRPDLFTLQRNSASGYGFLNNGNGTFGAPLFFSALGGIPSALTVGDVNGDGKPDILVASLGGDFGPDPVSLTVRLGNGNGGFTSVLPSGQVQGFPWGKITSLALADVNGDGKTDLLAVSSQGTLYVANGQGNGLFGATQTYHVGQGLTGQSYELAVGDFNGDGKPDVVVTNPRTGAVSVLLNNGNGTLATPVTYAVGGSPTAVALGDVTGDGNLDVVTANANGTVSVLPDLGNGTFAAPQTYALGGPANSVALGDFNGDGLLDIATTGSTEMDALLGNGSGGFSAYQKVGPAGSGVVAADFNGDGYPDLAQVDGAAGALEVIQNNANWGQPSFAVAGFPGSTTAGVAQAFTVTAVNPDGSVQTGYGGTVHFSSSDPQAVLPANATLVNGVGTFQAALKTAGAQSITATDAATGRVTGNEAGITVSPAAAASLVFRTLSNSTTAGATFNLTLAAKDAFGNVATGYAGTVHFTSSDPQAVLPADYTFASSDAGQHTFVTALETAGAQSVTAADTAKGGPAATEGKIGVTPAAAAKFVLSAPAGVKSGAKVTLTVTAEDAYGNVTGYPGGTLHFSSSDGTATLPKDDTITQAGSSVFTFTNAFVLKKKGVQTVTVTDTTNPALTGTVSITVS